MADVHKEQKIYLEDPKPIIPKAKSEKGRKPSKLKALTEAVRVDNQVKEQDDSLWKRVVVRDTAKGKLLVDILHKEVWLWNDEESEARQWHLIVRRETGSPNEIKYSLSNAKQGTSIQRLAYMQSQRYWVERPFQDAKNECGTGDCQVRGWLGWNHHMTMVMLAMLFMIEQRFNYQNSIPLLSCADITILLKSILPRRDITEAEILRQLDKRHKKRQASIDYAYQKQRIDGLLVPT